MAGIYNPTIDRTTDFLRQLTWVDQNNKPIDMTGYAAKMQFRKSKGSSSPLLVTIDNGANGGITLSNNGIITIELTTAQTALLTPDCYYDLVLTSPTNKPLRLIEGTVMLDRETTV